MGTKLVYLLQSVLKAVFKGGFQSSCIASESWVAAAAVQVGAVIDGLCENPDASSCCCCK